MLAETCRDRCYGPYGEETVHIALRCVQVLARQQMRFREECLQRALEDCPDALADTQLDVRVVTYNVAESAPEEAYGELLGDGSADILAVGLQEV